MLLILVMKGEDLFLEVLEGPLQLLPVAVMEVAIQDLYLVVLVVLSQLSPIVVSIPLELDFIIVFMAANTLQVVVEWGNLYLMVH